MIPYRNPQGYKQLLTWKQANQILELVEIFVTTLPKYHPKTNQKLADLADHMLRSARSLVRNIEEGFKRTTTQQYLDFLGFSAGSLEELLGDFLYCQKGNLGDQPLADKGIKLCKGESTMLFRQMKSLEEKMAREKTLPARDRMNLRRQETTEELDAWIKKNTTGLKKLENGQWVKK